MSSDEDDNIANEFKCHEYDSESSDEPDNSDASEDNEFYNLKPPPIPYHILKANMVELTPSQNIIDKIESIAYKINEEYKENKKKKEKGKSQPNSDEHVSAKESVPATCLIANILKLLIVKNRCHICRRYNKKHFKESYHYQNVEQWICAELKKYNKPENLSKYIFCQACNLPLSGLKNDTHYSEYAHDLNQQNFCTDCVRGIQEGGMAEHIQSASHCKNSNLIRNHIKLDASLNISKPEQSTIKLSSPDMIVSIQDNAHFKDNNENFTLVDTKLEKGQEDSSQSKLGPICNKTDIFVNNNPAFHIGDESSNGPTKSNTSDESLLKADMQLEEYCQKSKGTDLDINRDSGAIPKTKRKKGKRTKMANKAIINETPGNKEVEHEAHDLVKKFFDASNLCPKAFPCKELHFNLLKHLSQLITPGYCFLCDEPVFTVNIKGSLSNHYRMKDHIDKLLSHLKYRCVVDRFTVDESALIFCLPCHTIFCTFNEAFLHYGEDSHMRLFSIFCDVCLIFDNSKRHREHKTKFDRYVQRYSTALKFKIVKLHYLKHESDKSPYTKVKLFCSKCNGTKEHMGLPEVSSELKLQKRQKKSGKIEKDVATGAVFEEPSEIGSNLLVHEEANGEPDAESSALCLVDDIDADVLLLDDDSSIKDHFELPLISTIVQEDEFFLEEYHRDDQLVEFFPIQHKDNEEHKNPENSIERGCGNSEEANSSLSPITFLSGVFSIVVSCIMNFINNLFGF